MRLDGLEMDVIEEICLLKVCSLDDSDEKTDGRKSNHLYF